MKVCLFGILAFGVFALSLYTLAGRYVLDRVRNREERIDRVLQRSLGRCYLLLFAVGVLAVVATLLSRPEVPRVPALLLIYTLPLLWTWIAILGGSWLELKARGLASRLWRFHRFNLFAWFLTQGQRVPFVSAAVAAPRDLALGAGLIPGIALHLFLAVAVGLLLRHLVARGGDMEPRPLPEGSIMDGVRQASERAGVPFHGILLVHTERGQSVNAVAATSSRVIYLAQGLFEGLGREEVKAVLLHELGHLSQRATNLFRNVAVLGMPVGIWALLALQDADLEPGRTLSLLAGISAAILLGRSLSRRVYHSSEHRADLFAERWGTPGALASALRKLYARNLVAGGENRRLRKSHPALDARIRVLEEAAPAG